MPTEKRGERLLMKNHIRKCLVAILGLGLTGPVLLVVYDYSAIAYPQRLWLLIGPEPADVLVTCDPLILQLNKHFEQHGSYPNTLQGHGLHPIATYYGKTVYNQLDNGDAFGLSVFNYSTYGFTYVYHSDFGWLLND